MKTLTTPPGGLAPWRHVAVPRPLAAAERPAIGTNARVVVWPASALGPVLAIVDAELGLLDREVSRFRGDSELSRIANRGGEWVVSERLAEAISLALNVARWTEGRVDPTVGNVLVALGYDRDFSLISDDEPSPGRTVSPSTEAAGAPAVPGWRSVVIDGLRLRAPAGVVIDLGATAKALGADRAARAISSVLPAPSGVLVSLGGDMAVGGTAPLGGWTVIVADDHERPLSSVSQVVHLQKGGLATSSVTVRRWRLDGRPVHHIVDPGTGRPAEGPWRTVSVAAASCVDANAASTAALVAGSSAEQWLKSTGLPARLVAHNGTALLLGGWPARSGQPIEVPGEVICDGGSPVHQHLTPGPLTYRSQPHASPARVGTSQAAAS